MVSFDPPTGVTLGHILCYLSLHSYLSENLLQILIYLVGSLMNRIP
jgi:hypothetical protein